MNTHILLEIIRQRWAAACSSPSIPQWRSIAQWVENHADLCHGHPNTDYLVPELRRMADEAWDRMRALQPAGEMDGVTA